MTIATEVKSIMKDALNAHSKLSSAALVYISTLSDAEAMYKERGVKTHILYILTNLRAMTPEQKIAKKNLKEMAK